MGPIVRAGTVLVLGGACATAVAGLALPLQTPSAWTALCSAILVVTALTWWHSPWLLHTPPAARRARRWLANGYQAAAILQVGLGVAAIDKWWRTGADQRGWLALALVALGCLGYLGVRLGMVTRFLRPGPERPLPPVSD